MRPTEAEIRWALATFDAVFPPAPDVGAPVGARDVDMRAYYVDMIESAPGYVAAGYRAIVALVYWLPVFFTGRPTTLAGLPPDACEAYLDRWYHSRFYALRQGVTLVKMLAATGYMGFPEVQRQFGVDYPDGVPPVGERETRA